MPADRKHKVYKLTFPNGKVYVGYTGQSIKRRMSAHFNVARNYPKTPVHYAIRHFGSENVKVELIAEYDDKQSAIAAEMFFISHFNCMAANSNGYNLTAGGDSAPEGFGGSSWMRGKSAAEIAASNAKKARSANDNGFYGKRHSKESLARGVARRRERGSYDNANCSKSVIFDGVTYKSKRKLMQAIGVGRWRLETLIANGDVQYACSD